MDNKTDVDLTKYKRLLFFVPDVRKQGENERFKFSTNTGIYAAQLDGEVEIHYEYLFLT